MFFSNNNDDIRRNGCSWKFFRWRFLHSPASSYKEFSYLGTISSFRISSFGTFRRTFFVLLSFIYFSSTLLTSMFLSTLQLDLIVPARNFTTFYQDKRAADMIKLNNLSKAMQIVNSNSNHHHHQVLQKQMENTILRRFKRKTKQTRKE
jgi:hypothetical protein